MKTIIIRGITTRFKGDGRKLGYPTANLAVQTELKDGVYFGYADLAGYQHHPALIFVGTPTTMGETERRVEAHLLDIDDKNYYDRELKLYVERFHRPNKTFTDTEELLTAMRDDETIGRQWFGKLKP